MGIPARQNAVGQACPTYILRLDKALAIEIGLGLVAPRTYNESINAVGSFYLVATLNEELQRERELRETFLHELTPHEKAEFIGGERILHSPARAAHIRAAKRLMKLIDEYVMKHNLGEVFFKKTLMHLTRNDYEPDVLFYSRDKASQITPDQVLFPAPDFIAEILSDSTESRDRGIKFQDYAIHSVAEYWIIDADAEFVEQYTLVDQHYKLLRKLDSGLIAGVAVAGLEIPVAAIFNDDAHRAAMRSLMSNEL